MCQETKFTGRIVDAKTKEAVRYASVVVKGTNITTSSNYSGFFQLTGDSMEIEIFHINYLSSSVKLRPDNPNIAIPLPPLTYELNPVKITDTVVAREFVYKEELWRQETEERKAGKGGAGSIAEFPGGLENFHLYLNNSILAQKDSIRCNFEPVVSFHINPKGSLVVDFVSNARADSAYYVQLFNNSPSWVPAYQGQLAVNSRYTQKITVSPEVEYFLLNQIHPQFIGGLDKFYKFLENKINYPGSARRQGIEGRVYVQFVVTPTGEVKDVKVVKGIGGGCDEEAARVVQLTSGMWKPGTIRGKIVDLRMVIPILFHLNDLTMEEKELIEKTYYRMHQW